MSCSLTKRQYAKPFRCRFSTRLRQLFISYLQSSFFQMLVGLCSRAPYSAIKMLLLSRAYLLLMFICCVLLNVIYRCFYIRSHENQMQLLRTYKTMRDEVVQISEQWRIKPISKVENDIRNKETMRTVGPHPRGSTMAMGFECSPR